MLMKTKSPLYNRCVKPVVDMQKQELFDRIRSIRHIKATPAEIEKAVKEPKVIVEKKPQPPRESPLVKIKDGIPTLRYIASCVSTTFQVPYSTLIESRRRHATETRARQIAYYIAYRFTHRSLPEIGRFFAGRDHTTVLHGVRKINDLYNDGHWQTHADISLVLRELSQHYEFGAQNYWGA